MKMCRYECQLSLKAFIALCRVCIIDCVRSGRYEDQMVEMKLEYESVLEGVGVAMEPSVHPTEPCVRRLPRARVAQEASAPGAPTAPATAQRAPVHEEAGSHGPVERASGAEPTAVSLPLRFRLTWLGPREERRTQELRAWVEQRQRHRHRHRKMMESSIKYKWSNSHDGKRRPRTSSETAASRLRSLYNPRRPSFVVQRNCSGRVEGGADIAPLHTERASASNKKAKKYQ